MIFGICLRTSLNPKRMNPRRSCTVEREVLNPKLIIFYFRYHMRVIPDKMHELVLAIQEAGFAALKPYRWINALMTRLEVHNVGGRETESRKYLRVCLIFFCSWKMPYINASLVGGHPGT